MSRALSAALALALIAGCAASEGPPVMRIGMPCAACGMEIRDLAFACARGDGRAWRRYDAIECLLRDGTGGAAWLTDYDTKAVRPAAECWVVQGSFPSPMGGGFAAFVARGAADSVAAATAGRVDRLAAFAEAPR